MFLLNCFILIFGVQCTIQKSRKNNVEEVERIYKHDLSILPSHFTEVRAGSNIVLTCKLQGGWQVADTHKLSWYDPREKLIHNNDRIYAEVDTSAGSISLFIKKITKAEGGKYMCIRDTGTNTYARRFVHVNVYDGLQWVESPALQYGSLNQSATILCRGAATSVPRIDWLRNESQIKPGGRYRLTEAGLQISAVRREDEGFYTCRATVLDTGEMEELDIQFKIGLAPGWIAKPENITVRDGSELKIDCRGEGFPAPRSSWRVPGYNGPTVYKNGTVFFQSVSQDVEDWEYVCTVENLLGKLESRFYITVVHLPDIQTITNITVQQGQRDVKLLCRVTANSPTKVTWLKRLTGNETLSKPTSLTETEPGLRIKDEVDDNELDREYFVKSTVIIGVVDRLHAGVYICEAENQGGKVSKVGSVTVEYPPVIHDSKATVYTWHQQTVLINCSVDSRPESELSWMFNGQYIGRKGLEDKNFRVGFNTSFTQLQIVPVSDKYLGAYTCKAANSLGPTTQTTQLVQATEPGEIQQFVLEKISSTRVQFRIVDPKYTGGQPILEYLIEYKENRMDWLQTRRKVWLPSPSKRYTLENLMPTKTYTFRISAKNRVGMSPWSPESSLTLLPPGKPDPPVLNLDTFTGVYRRKSGISVARYSEDIDLNSSDYGILDLQWELQDDRGAAIFAILLQYYPVILDGERWLQAGNTTILNISSLFGYEVVYDAEHFNYYLSVQAENEFGLSSKEEVIFILKNESVPGPLPAPIHQPTVVSVFTVLLGVSICVLCAVILDIVCLISSRKGVIYTFCTRTKMCRKMFGNKKNGRSYSGSKLRRSSRKGRQDFV